MRSFWQSILVLTLVICLLPSIFILGVWTTVYGMILVPMIFAGFMIWRFIKAKGWLTNSVPPAYATTHKPAPKKKHMIKWKGKELPLGIFIASMITAVILTPILLVCLLVVFPPVISACIIGFFSCKAIGSMAHKEKTC